MWWLPVVLLVGLVSSQSVSRKEVQYALLEKNVLEMVRPILDNYISQKVAAKGNLKLEEDVRNRSDVQYQMMEDKIMKERTLLYKEVHLHNGLSTLHKNVHLSRDRLSISGTVTPFDWPRARGDKEFQNYKGVRSSGSVSVPDTLCYEVDVYYSMHRNFPSDWLVFELGLARSDVIDQSFYIGWQPTHAWSFSVSRNSITGYMETSCNTGQTSTNNEVVSNSTAGTSYHVTVGIRVNTADRTMLVVDTRTNHVFCNFTNIDVTEELWPVFSVYPAVHVRLTIKNSFLMTRKLHWIYL